MAAERKIDDAELTHLRGLWAEGWSATDLAAEFGVSRQHIGRLVRDEQRPVISGLDPEAVRHGVVAAVDSFLDDADLGSGDAVLAASARALAVKVDGCAASSSAGAAQAMPRLCGELVDVLERLQGRTPREPDAVDHLNQRRAARRLTAVAGVNGNVKSPKGA